MQEHLPDVKCFMMCDHFLTVLYDISMLMVESFVVYDHPVYIALNNSSLSYQ